MLECPQVINNSEIKYKCALPEKCGNFYIWMMRKFGQKHIGYVIFMFVLILAALIAVMLQRIIMDDARPNMYIQTYLQKNCMRVCHFPDLS